MFIQVNPAHTSQTCPKCRHVHEDNRVDRDHFKCVQCGFSDEADFVGSVNVLDRALETLKGGRTGRDCAHQAKGPGRNHGAPKREPTPNSREKRV